jgi:hypothetical protein
METTHLLNQIRINVETADKTWAEVTPKNYSTAENDFIPISKKKI